MLQGTHLQFFKWVEGNKEKEEKLDTLQYTNWKSYRRVNALSKRYVTNTIAVKNTDGV